MEDDTRLRKRFENHLEEHQGAKNKIDRKGETGVKVRRWCLAGLWILSLVAISNNGGAVSYGFFFGVTLLPVLSLVYLVLVYLLFRIYQKVESRTMVCGQPMPYFFVLQNDGFFPFTGVSVKLFSSFSYVETLPGDTEYELLAKDKYTFETKMVCRYRGEYEVGVKEIIVTDFLRLFRLSYRIPETIKAIVYPKITRVSALNAIGDLSVLLLRDTSVANTEPDVVVRDYVSGDALKQMHWKATAREQKLKIRNRIGEEKQGIVLLMDTRRCNRQMKEYLPVESKMLEALLALGIFMAERNMGFTVYYGQNGIVEKHVESLQNYDLFYEEISKVVYREEEDFLSLLTHVVDSGCLLNCRLVFAVLHEMTTEIFHVTESLTKAGVPVVLYVVTEENIEDFVRQGNERMKIIALPVEEELEGRL